MTTKELNSRQVQWVEKLTHFDFTIEHRSSKTNPIDLPSRHPNYEMTKAKRANVALPTIQKLLRQAKARKAPYVPIVRDEMSPMDDNTKGGEMLPMNLFPMIEDEMSPSEDSPIDIDEMSIIEDSVDRGEILPIDIVTTRLLLLVRLQLTICNSIDSIKSEETILIAHAREGRTQGSEVDISYVEGNRPPFTSEILVVSYDDILDYLDIRQQVLKPLTSTSYYSDYIPRSTISIVIRT